MNALRNILVLVLVLVCGVGVVRGAKIYTTGTSSSPGTIHALASEAGDYCCMYTTSGGFTVDGEPLEDVWAIILSKIGDYDYLTGYGRSSNEGANFRFTIFGRIGDQYAASHIIPVINDDNSNLLAIVDGHDGAYLCFFNGEENVIPIDDEGNTTTVTFEGSDRVLPLDGLSINGGGWGDVSAIVFDYNHLVMAS